MNASVASLRELFARLADDPERPDRVDGTWRFADLVDGPISAGVWSATAETIAFENYAVDEVMLMLGGRLRLIDADGTSHILEKDDLFYLPKGWSGTWEILEDMQKLYVIIE